MQELLIQELKEEDLPSIKEIYDFYVENSTATFHTHKQTIDQLKDFIPINQEKYKAFIIKKNGIIIGYCYFGPYKKREAFYRCAEVTIYLRNNQSHNNIGQFAIKKLEEAAKEQRIQVLLAVITGENTQSIHFFEKLGYRQCGNFIGIGEKFGRILDLVTYQKFLQ